MVGLALLVLRSVGFVCRGKTKCANAGWLKIELKKCAVGKIKNTEGSALSVSFPIVQLYVLKVLFTCQIL